MIRSLYSGVSGLTTHQVRMDVIGNNIANVNTYGFKASRVTFRDIFYQTSIGASGGRQTFTGNNASQVGYGVQLGSIDKDMSTSNLQTTNRGLDCAIAGEAFFATATFDNQNVNSDKTAANFMYTKMGNFEIDSFGNLCTSNNVFVMGSRNTLDGMLAKGDDSLTAMHRVEYVDRDGDGVINSTDVRFRDTLNLNEMVANAYNIYTDQAGYMYGYDWNAIIAGSGDEGDDAVPAFAGVVYDRAKAEAEGYVVTVDDTTGAQTLSRRTAGDADAAGGTEPVTDIKILERYVDIQATLTNLNATKDAVGNPIEEPGIAYRYYVTKTGDEIRVNNQRPDYGTLYRAFFGAGGGDGGAGGDGAATQLLNPDSDEYKAAASTAGNNGALIGKFTIGDVEACSIGQDGIITVSYNSTIKSIGRINVVVFDNPDGLVEDGQTTFVESVASGQPKYKRPKVDPGVTKITIESGRLEMSNVNLAQEFSDMIVTQRGFQANARMVTTSDSMLEELVNLKR